MIFCKSPISILQKKVIGELYRVIPFPVAHSMYAEVTLNLIFPIQTSIEQKCKRAPLVLHRFVRHKYLHEDHSMAQTVVSLSSSYTELFWKTSYLSVLRNRYCYAAWWGAGLNFGLLILWAYLDALSSGCVLADAQANNGYLVPTAAVFEIFSCSN